MAAVSLLGPPNCCAVCNDGGSKPRITDIFPTTNDANNYVTVRRLKLACTRPLLPHHKGHDSAEKHSKEHCSKEGFTHRTGFSEPDSPEEGTGWETDAHRGAYSSAAP